MRTWTPLLAVAALLLGGCSGAGDPRDQPGALPSSAPSSAESSAPSSAPTEVAPGSAEVAASEGCAEVRAGIDAFNAGDFDETVARFRAAVPLVEAQADGSTASNQLVEAVRWYAALPAEDYLQASQDSEEFQTYKAITLGQCIDALLPQGGSADPGQDA